MPLHIAQRVVTQAQIEEVGVAGLHEWLIGHALGGDLAHLKDGRAYVVQIHPRQPQPLPGHDGQFSLKVEIRWLIAHPDQAEVGEIVYAPMLSADDKGEEVERFEATRGGKRFEPTVNGWKRVALPHG